MFIYPVQPVCTFLHIPAYIIMSTVYCPAHYIIAHFIIFYDLFLLFIVYFLLSIFHTYIYVYSLMFELHIIALSMEQT